MMEGFPEEPPSIVQENCVQRYKDHLAIWKQLNIKYLIKKKYLEVVNCDIQKEWSPFYNAFDGQAMFQG